MPGWEFSDKIYVPLPVAILDFGPWRQMSRVKLGMVILNGCFILLVNISFKSETLGYPPEWITKELSISAGGHIEFWSLASKASGDGPSSLYFLISRDLLTKF